MSLLSDAWSVRLDPDYPHKILGWDVSPDLVLPLVGAAALALVFLTIWTYAGVQQATSARVATVVGLRLAALLTACLALLRPSLAGRDEAHESSVLVIVVDASESMTITEGGVSRWTYAQRILRECEPALRRLKEDNDVAIHIYHFAGDVNQVVPEGQSDTQRASISDLLKALGKVKPDGKRTDFGRMLFDLREIYSSAPNRRGLVIISDGADNGSHRVYKPLDLANQWRDLPCPIQPFAVGDEKTSKMLDHISIRTFDSESPTVPMKGELIVKATVDAPGRVGNTFEPHLFIDGREIPTRIFLDDQEVKPDKKDEPKYRRTDANELKLQCTLPPDIGDEKKSKEVKVTLRIGKDKEPNNEMSTYVTITKEGFSVLFVDRARYVEPQDMMDYLAKEKRINLHPVWFRKDENASVKQTDLFKFQEQKYDVIILGDITARQLKSGNPNAFAIIEERVRKGAGVLLLGGNNFGAAGWNDQEEWKELLPVDAKGAKRPPGFFRMRPADDLLSGRDRFMLRLADDPAASLDLWKRLEPLAGLQSFRIKEAREFESKGAPVLLADAVPCKKEKDGTYTEDKNAKPAPVMVWRPYVDGRVLVFAGDSTNGWMRPETEGSVEAFARFWQRTVLWLAKQDQGESNIRVELPNRRLPAGEAADFRLSLRDKGGNEVEKATFQATLIKVDPQGDETPITTSPKKDGTDPTGEHGTLAKENIATPGEYALRVSAKGTGADGSPVEGEPVDVRFLVYQDETETIVQAANHTFLKSLAAEGGGRFHQADELAAYLKELADQPLLTGQSKDKLYPDWRTKELSPFLVGFFILFVALLCLEWLLRRRWGLV